MRRKEEEEEEEEFTTEVHGVPHGGHGVVPVISKLRVFIILLPL